MSHESGELSVLVGEIKLTYREYGKPDAPPMVFIHGLSASAQDWAGIVPAFADRYHLFALNLRGHASSDYPGAYSFDLIAQDIIGFLDALHLKMAILVGHSLGGIVSFFVAGKYPERVKALVMEEAPPPRPTGKVFDFGGRPAGKLSFDWAAMTGILSELNHPDPTWWDSAAYITAPTLMIGGGSTSHVPQEWIADLAARIPDCRVVTLGGGHVVHSAHPQEFIREVSAFLNRLK